jgi:hypothetical protein
MRNALLLSAIAILFYPPLSSQTKIVGNYIQPYSINATEVQSPPAGDPVETLQSPSRTIQLFDIKYSSSIVFMENGKFLAYAIDPFIQVEKYEIKQLNGNGLPELILHVMMYGGSGYSSFSDSRIIIIDFDLNQVLWDLPSDRFYHAGTEEFRCSLTFSFFDGRIEISNVDLSTCDDLSFNDVTTGTYLFKDNKYYLPSNHYAEVFKNFWSDFTKAVNTGNKTFVVNLTSGSFYDGVMFSYANSSKFMEYYQFYINEDVEFMIRHAKINQTIEAPKRKGGYDVEYEDGATISFLEVKDPALLKKYRNVFKLDDEARVYVLNYNYARILSGSSHPYQSVSSYLYFGHTESGLKLCGKGMVL